MSAPQPKKNKPGAGRPTKEGEAATSQIFLRVTPRRKSAYVKAAAPRGLAEWCFEHLDKAAGYDPNTSDDSQKRLED